MERNAVYIHPQYGPIYIDPNGNSNQVNYDGSIVEVSYGIIDYPSLPRADADIIYMDTKVTLNKDDRWDEFEVWCNENVAEVWARDHAHAAELYVKLYNMPTYSSDVVCEVRRSSHALTESCRVFDVHVNVQFMSSPRVE